MSQSERVETQMSSLFQGLIILRDAAQREAAVQLFFYGAFFYRTCKYNKTFGIHAFFWSSTIFCLFISAKLKVSDECG